MSVVLLIIKAIFDTFLCILAIIPGMGNKRDIVTLTIIESIRCKESPRFVGELS